MKGKMRTRLSKAMALTLSASMLLGSTISVNAETVSSGDAMPMNVLAEAVSSGDAVTGGDLLAGDYLQFTEDKLVASYAFGTDVTADSVYADGVGFYNETYNDAARGWDGGVYYPRVKTAAEGADFVKAADGSLAISSKVWTETESTGYGVYTYENTSSFAMELAPADYKVAVTFVNPTASEYVAYVEAEDITKASGIKVAAGSEATAEVTAVLVDGKLEIKFLAESTSTSADAAATQTVYVKRVDVTRLATGEAGAKPTIYLASDSTVQTYDKGYYPQTGWGQTLACFFGGSIDEREADNCTYSQAQIYEAENAIVENRAIGGRSSYSFIAEGKLDDLLEDIKPGDYLFVQWGHNDATAARPNRYVAPADFEQWIQYYVDGALQRGATPVLVTPVARYSYTTNSDGSLNTFVGNFEAYGNVMREMAAEQNLPIVDLTARSVAVCNNFGIEGAKSLFLHVNAGDYPEGAYAGGATDSTHLQYYGAYKFAQCVAQGIQESSLLSGLASKVVMTIPETVPAKVEGLASGSVGASSVNMSWNTTEGAELYYIYRAVLGAGETVDSVEFSDANKYSVSATNKYADANCESGVTYVYAVRGFNEKGLGEFSDKIVVTTKAAGQKFDFNYNNSPTMEGWTGVNQDQMYDATVGYGWITAPGNGRNRAGSGNADASAMADDFCLGAGEFAVDLPNGDYEVTVYACDLLPGTSTIKPSYTAEGVSLGSISTKQALGSTTNTVRVVDGQLNIVVGGTNQYINGMTITEILKSPSGLVDTEHSVNGNQMTFLIGFNGVDEAVSYNVYRKSTSDADFSVIKSFTVEEYAADDLACRAMIIDLGESYQYYMTCVTADGTESAPSNTITVEGVLKGAAVAKAPQNVVCVSPVEGATELAREITIQWDAAEVDSAYPVIKYIVYRSERAEDEKGFSGFEKIGETTETTYTDKDGVATNISYYYKVAALNAGGLGEQSAACKTPVTGKLVAGGLENYTDRAVVAINLAGNDGGEVNVSATDANGNELTQGVYLSWRAFEADMNAKNELTTTFTVYRNGEVIASNIAVTNLVDEGGSASDTYKVVGSNDAAQNLTAKDTKVWANKYLELNLFCPADETMPDGSTTDFHANDMSVGDIDGDGDLELFVKWYPANAKDNSGSGYTGKTYIDAYEVDFATGATKLLWRLDMGVNIRSGAHYTQFQVWDFDCDGKAEIAVKAADGTTMYVSEDGTDKTLSVKSYVGACDSSALPVNVISAANDYRNASGYVLDGPEYFVMFNCDDASKFDEVTYTPVRGTVGAWGDGYGNRVDRFLSATAYLNGETPFAVFCRGYYTRTCLTAYYLKDTDGNGIGDTIAEYWAFDTNQAGSQYEAQGNHGLSVNDVDNDGKDEIIYGALVVDNDGTVLYSTGLGHGDAMHVSDWVSWNKGLEIMSVHEHNDATYHVEVRDAETGTILMGYNTGKDTGRGVAADIDATAEGAEWWSIASPTYEDNDEPAWDSLKGEVYSTWSTMENLIKLADSTPASNASIFWDGDLLSEIQDHTFNSDAYAPTGVVIYKWNTEKEVQEPILKSSEIWSTNGTKGNLGLVADILGDWREEIIARTSANKNVVRVYSTTIQTDYVVPCLLEDLAYREGVAWQNVGYNQPANTAYLLSQGLVTAQLSLGDVSYNSATINFTPANDGDLYGHDIEGYEVYRKLAAEDDAEFEKIATIANKDLVNDGSAPQETAEPTATPETKTYFFKEDFEDGASDFKLIAEGNTANEYLEADTSTTNANTSSYVYGVGSRAGGDTGTQVSGLNITENVIFETDLKMDGCVQGKSSNFALLGAANKLNWLDSASEILTISATANGNGYWGTITVNGVDITSAAKVSGESSGKGGLNRDTTGWLKVKAELDFATQTVDVVITRIADGSTVYEAEVPFMDADVTALDAIYLAAGKTYGGVFVDNVAVYKENKVEATATPEPTATPDVITQVVKNVLFSEDFEDGASDFKLIAEGNTANEYLEKDTSTVNANASEYVYGVGSRAGGDTGTQVSGLKVTENVTFQTDLKMDGCVQGKSSNFALLGAANKLNWLDSASEILTISASASGNGYWGTITVNGVDITSAAKVSGESSGKGGLNRDTTGWLTVKAELDFAAQTADVTITRISDGSSVYEGTVPFVDGTVESPVSTLDAVFMAAGKTYGGVFVDNVSIWKEEVVVVTPDTDDTESDSSLYAYTDKSVESNTSYEYKIAAIVDGKTSHMSAPLTVKTNIEITSVKDFELDAIVEDTVLADGQTVADLLPKTVTVVDAEGSEVEADVTWDVSAVDLTTPGTYKVVATVAGYGEKISKDLVVLAVEVKGVASLDDIELIAGQTLTLPEKVAVEYTNGVKEEVNVVWDSTGVDVNAVAKYEVTGTVEGFDATATVVVNVVANYMVSAADVYVEVALNAYNVDEVLPKTVTVTWADGSTTKEAVSWSTSGVLNEIATYAVLGTVDGLEKGAAAYVSVAYPLIGRFDFGIKAGYSVDGWTEITVNPKGGEKNCDTLGVTYSAEKGYGFTDGTMVMQGRQEGFTFEGSLPVEVYNDFAIPDGNTFAVDVEDGTYQVEILSNSTYKSTVKSTVEGTGLNVSNAVNSYAWGTTQVEVTDGQLSIAFTSGATSRCGAIVIRQIVEAKEPGTDEPVVTATPVPTEAPTEEPVVTEAPTEAPTEEPVVTEAPTEEPVVTEAPTEEPVVTEAPTEAPVVTEAPTEAPVVTPAPTATPSPEVSVGEVIMETIVTIGKLLFADTKEEVVEIVKDYIGAIKGLWAHTCEVAESAMEQMASVEDKIREEFNSDVAIVSSQNNTLGITDIDNALLTIPTGANLNVGAVEVSEEQVAEADKLGITGEQMEDAEAFSLELVDPSNGQVMQLEAPVRVSFHVPERMGGKELKLVHFAHTGTEVLNVNVEGNIGSAVIRSFSDFALVAVADAPVDDANNNTENKEESFVDVILGAISPKMGDDSDGSSWLLIAVLGIVCVVAAVAGVSILRKKEEK